MRWLRRTAAGLILLLVSLVAGLYLLGRAQGLDAEALTERSGARVTFDRYNIPTIEAADWEKMFEAQGYVVASERLFQMDLMRRAGAGRLSELFGALAVEMDRVRHEEDWLAVADREARSLSREEAAYLEAYARGVNRFIDENPWRWGVEYLFLQERPEPWQVRDSLLITLLMAESLTGMASHETLPFLWSELLPSVWHDFLFTPDHPWNEPLFGDAKRPVLPRGHALPSAPLTEQEKIAVVASPSPSERPSYGSNDWGWCGKSGCFLANDPHLQHDVPHLWYGVRLRRSADDWVVGTHIPGLPGVVLGMNPYLAWAFTNVGEDVEDYLLEKLDAGEKNYLARMEGDREVWAPITEKPYRIKVRGKSDVEGIARFTHRGPLVRREMLDGFYAHQWLGLKPGFLRHPVRLNFAKNWDELNAALDEMRLPAQNVTMIDRHGNLGYRASGTTIGRRITGLRPQPAIEGEWTEFLPTSTRPRLLYYVKSSNGDAPATEDHALQGPQWSLKTVTATVSRFIATNNQRIWTGDFGHSWDDDLRHERIRRALASQDEFTGEEMTRLQLDTESRYHHELLSWLARYAKPADEKGRATVERWKKWNGVAETDARTFSEAIKADNLLTSFCIQRVKKHLLLDNKRNLEYQARQRTGWIVEMLSHEDGLSVFGLDPQDVADAIVEHIVKNPPDLYVEKNIWGAQHPFTLIPVIGALFRVEAPKQIGYRDFLRVEEQRYGASVRLVWNIHEPMKSTWSLPVGQSGHVFSEHFKDFQAGWFQGEVMPVFDDRFEWKVAH